MALGEFGFIQWLRERQPATDATPVPAGDDLAVLRWADDRLLVGADQVLDGVHFDLRSHQPRQIGAKAMNRNLSDCAAMGCLPVAAVVCMALPQGAGSELARELYLGLEAAGAAFDCAIVGGDTGSWPHPLAVTVSIFGKADGVSPMRRSGARPGDLLYVSGPLGGSLLGRHLTFSPRVHLGREIARRGAVHAMIDLSDGLSRDAAHLCAESRVSATIEANRVPIHADASQLARTDGRSPLHHALHDGEDYELLAAVPPGLASVAEALSLTRVGYCEPGEGLFLLHEGRREPMPAGAWEHTL